MANTGRVHKVTASTSGPLCGKCVASCFKSNRWSDVTCTDCWRFARPHIVKKYKAIADAKIKIYNMTNVWAE